ncbi:mitochondrial ornithine transporter 1 isoform X2 [Xenopus tropicalis]|uniref:Mitochondrial ornithine transporter 1 isoform X2 n=1 Tax=Xenopus tropicalis TaxID=8364 RepID=A0A8J0T6G2_XENTR|nr:mitochondrial ornithine transporter 1 isoform X2 [Xenopus tropicalis]|eukprot:XP_017952310.1 PREDICTED: mitochondrial ornithine transporter 1-like isoform X2 [Xenopus tropicalis]
MPSEKAPPTHLKQILINLIAGAMGGVACVVSGQPFDTAKVKMQTFPTMYRGFVDCAVRTYHAEGLRGLYHGTTPALVANAAENAVLFACYGFCQNLVSRCLGLQDPSQLSTPWSVVRAILSSEGIPGLFRGLSSTWLREIPGYFFFFGGYELSIDILSQRESSKDPPGALVVTVSGGVGGACFWLAVYPVDSVKSRVQVLTLTPHSKGFIISLLHILRTEGFLPLYSGLMPTVVRAFPSNAALFLAYEMTKRTLTEYCCAPI